MGLLDFDDEEILRNIVPADKRRFDRPKYKENFEDLQSLGHKQNSRDFEDSPVADRRPIELEDDGEEMHKVRGNEADQ